MLSSVLLPLHALPPRPRCAFIAVVKLCTQSLPCLRRSVTMAALCYGLQPVVANVPMAFLSEYFFSCAWFRPMTSTAASRILVMVAHSLYEYAGANSSLRRCRVRRRFFVYTSFSYACIVVYKRCRTPHWLTLWTIHRAW